MFDFIITTFTSLLVAVGLVSSVPVSEPISNQEFVAESEPVIEFISENTIEQNTISEEERLRQEGLATQLQRDKELEEARKLRAVREAQIAAERARAEVQAAKPQQSIQTTAAVEATEVEIEAERAAVTEYSQLVDQYTPLLNAWREIINEHEIEYLASVVNDRIITVRTINAIAKANQYSLPDSYTPAKLFYEDLYTKIEQLVPDIVYVRGEITSVSRYIEARGGFTAAGITDDSDVKNVLRAFINDAVLSNPQAFAAKLATHKAAVSRLDSGYVQTMKTVEAAVVKFAKEKSTTISTTVPCWQLQINYRDDWEKINERYAAQNSFFSANRKTEVSDLEQKYERDYPACF